jgi:hypothetical protein
MKSALPNKRGAGKGGIAVLWCAGRAWPALPDRERSAKSSNANGVSTQRVVPPQRDYPGIAITMSSSTPTGLRPPIGRNAGGTPLGFIHEGRLPRVGARSSRQPWALLRNAVGVGRTDGCASSANVQPVPPHEPPPASRISPSRIFKRWIRSQRALTAAVGERGRSAN